MPTFHRVCPAEESPSEQVRLVEAGGVKVALCAVAGKYYALSNFCPHLTGNLAEGSLDGAVLICPEHGWRFRVDSGRCLTVRGRNAHSFPVRIANGWVEVGV